MSRTLNLVDILLASGRNLVSLGRYTEALTALNRLAEFRSLPEHVLEELHSLRADIHLQQQNYKDARRCLTAAIALRPLNARHQYLMGIAIEEDESASLKRAEMYFASAVKLEHDNPAYWVDYGSYLFKIGKAKAALKALRKAYALDNNDTDVVGQVAETLRREGLHDEATKMLRTSLFASHGADSFRQLWQKHQFALIHARQQPEACEGSEEGAVILPFQAAPVQRRFVDLGARTIRIDPPEPLKEPTVKKPVSYKRPPKG